MTSQCSCDINKLKIFAYNFNEKWKDKHLFINVNNKCLCLICNSSIAVSKKCNVEPIHGHAQRLFCFKKGTYNPSRNFILP